ncbi:MAG: hypothetical protein U5L03_15155 [Burkholderiaceae bacterium]|nr:hypothetical protein [Burkholderiaceae bacterium]
MQLRAGRQGHRYAAARAVRRYWSTDELVEVKPLAVLRRDWALLRPKFSAATRYARRLGW